MSLPVVILFWFLVSVYAVLWVYAAVFLGTSAVRAAWFGDYDKRKRIEREAGR